MTETSAKGSAYGELGNLHRSMGNFEQAAACYGQQLKLAKQCQDLESESDAECGLGEVRLFQKFHSIYFTVLLGTEASLV